MNNVGKEFYFFSSCGMHDRGLHQECMILIAQVKILLQIPAVI